MSRFVFFHRSPLSGMPPGRVLRKVMVRFPMGELAVLYLPVKRRLVRVYKAFFEDEKLPSYVGSNWEVY